MHFFLGALKVNPSTSNGFFVRFDIVKSGSRVVNRGTGSKRRYWYFFTTAHSGTFEMAPKDKKV